MKEHASKAGSAVVLPGELQILDLPQPADDRVPTGAGLVHQPPLMITRRLPTIAPKARRWASPAMHELRLAGRVRERATRRLLRHSAKRDTWPPVIPNLNRPQVQVAEGSAASPKLTSLRQSTQ